MSRAEIEAAVRYHHPEKTLATLPTRPEISDDMIAPFFGTDVETYKEIKTAFAERARRCARELLRDRSVADLVERLPFEPGTTVVGIGDSITDDLLSWFEILRHLFAESRPESEVRFVNAGISGDTTSRLLSRVLYVLEEEPAWILILIGTNDVPFVREPPTKTLVSREETAGNLRALRDLTKSKSDVRLVWMTPLPVNEDRTASVPAWQPAWRNEDLKKVARLVGEVAGKDPIVDLGKAFGDPANPELLLLDGLHPSLTGQKTIAAALVERLARV